MKAGFWGDSEDPGRPKEAEMLKATKKSQSRTSTRNGSSAEQPGRLPGGRDRSWI